MLHQVVTELIIPQAVYAEVTQGGSTRADADEIRADSWIERRLVRNTEALAELPTDLGSGKREAIILAKEEKLALLMDDRKARRVAEERQISVVGSLWVMAEAKRAGFIPVAEPLVDELLVAGYWMHEERVVRPFLRELGE